VSDGSVAALLFAQEASEIATPLRRLLAVLRYPETDLPSQKAATPIHPEPSICCPAHRRLRIARFRRKKTPANAEVFRAADGIRTHDLLHGKQTL
jgi:hypothetical protein